MERASAMDRAKLLAKRVRDHRVIGAYRRLFTDGNGALTADAVEVIADLTRVARSGIADDRTMSDADLRDYSARRTVLLHILSRMDLNGARLAQLAAQVREETR